MSVIQLIFIVIVGYLLGSLPNAYIVTLLVKRINIFEVGSGNMGGTNVARTLGLGWGVFTVVLDALKGSLAVVAAQYIATGIVVISPSMATGMPSDLLIPSMLGSLSAVAGHNWSLFATALYFYYQKTFEIKGGKGAATAYGSMLVLFPFFANIILITVGVALAVITRLASLSVLVCFSVSFISIIVWAMLSETVSILHIVHVILLAILIVWRFRENIERLLAGNERRIGERVQT